MTIKLLIFCSLVVMLTLFATPGITKDTDRQVWTNMTAMGPIHDNHRSIRYWLEIQDRIGEDVSQLSQILLRPGLGYEFSPTASAWVGYAFIHTYRPFSQQPVDENRLWQQLLWSKNYTPLKLSARSRLEERFIQRVPETAWRYRQLVKTNIHTTLPKYDVVITEEAFIHLNNFNLQKNRGFDQNRLFIGLGYKASKNSTVEVGYLNQLIKRTRGNHYIGNYLALTLLLT
ncbi:DUF2490 domain-containing protein [Legionella waltersii]|nr:DUF2490 domain-containing protein [Legionella waltersii]